jgi:hypothetical protein
VYSILILDHYGLQREIHITETFHILLDHVICFVFCDGNLGVPREKVGGK